MIKYTQVKCLKDVLENDVLIFIEDEIYKIVRFNYNSLVYFIEPEFYEDNPLPDEFVVFPLNKNFEFLYIK